MYICYVYGSYHLQLKVYEYFTPFRTSHVKVRYRHQSSKITQSVCYAIRYMKINFNRI